MQRKYGGRGGVMQEGITRFFACALLGAGGACLTASGDSAYTALISDAGGRPALPTSYLLWSNDPV